MSNLKLYFKSSIKISQDGIPDSITLCGVRPDFLSKLLDFVYKGEVRKSAQPSP